MNGATNCVWCSNGGNQPDAVGPICDACATELEAKLSKSAGGVGDD